MARKADAEDLLAELDQLSNENATPPLPASHSTAPPSSQPPLPTTTSPANDDVIADLEKQLAAKPASSRPGTPKVGGNTKFTPPSSGRNSSEEKTGSASAGKEKGRGSADGARSYHTAYVPSQDQQREEEKVAESSSGGGGWFSSLMSTATAAVKQAETLAKEIRSNEEANRWAEQVRGSVNNLQSFGTAISRFLPPPLIC